MCERHGKPIGVCTQCTIWHAEKVDELEPFALNPEPKPVFWKAQKQPKPRQTVLFSGLNLIAGQNDLFETDGRAE